MGNIDIDSQTQQINMLIERFGKDTGRKLFVPERFDFSRPGEILKFVAGQPFAQFISTGCGVTHVTAAPIIHSREINDGSCFCHEYIGHIARRNPQVEAVSAGLDAVALVLGPHAYTSPRWYREKPGLPTWSYVSVQLFGVFDEVTDIAETREILKQTIEHMERDADDPWTLDEAPGEFVESLIQHIAAFRFKVKDMQGIRRLNQHKSLFERQGIIEGLSKSSDPGAGQIAEMMLADVVKQSGHASYSRPLLK